MNDREYYAATTGWWMVGSGLLLNPMGVLLIILSLDVDPLRVVDPDWFFSGIGLLFVGIFVSYIATRMIMKRLYKKPWEK